MLNLMKALFEFDTKVFGGLLYMMIGKLDGFPILKEFVSLCYIVGTRIDLKALELIDKKLGE